MRGREKSIKKVFSKGKNNTRDLWSKPGGKEAKVKSLLP